MRVAIALIGLLVALPPGARAADDPFADGGPLYYVPAADLLPALPVPPSDGVRACDGSLRCVDGVIRDMRRRWRPLDAACDHDAVFAFTYLVTTETYRDFVRDPAFFTDNAFVNNQDRLFANFYFQAHDAWAAGDVARVPPAWRVAFRAAEQGAVKGMGNVLLGMNAHIQRDLPFVLYAIGLTKPDGATRKTDHDRVNLILRAAADRLLDEAAERYDPSLASGDLPGTALDATALNLTLQAMREAAWRNAEALALAPDGAARLLVARSIEAEAWLAGLALRAAFAYGLFDGPAARDAYCEGRDDGAAGGLLGGLLGIAE
ncbi:MAG: hypothetical protein H6704_05815 [Myxococcales bacterium]|nr:hypothetical protein [Myxococcales bacterium]